MTQLTDEQKQQVASWIDAGAKLAEIQDRLDKELGVRLTYMDVRLLTDDLKLTPKDPEPPTPPVAPSEPEADDALEVLPPEGSASEPTGMIGGKVSVVVDQLARPGSMVSGKVTFSDGQTAEWHMDQYGRLGLAGAQPGYRPPESDIAEFQAALDRELAKMGL